MVNQSEQLLKRVDGREPGQIRPIDFVCDALGYASASVFFSQGNTKVLASITLQQGLPPFLKGQPTGWLSAEYAMLPNATHQRTNRESSGPQRNARSVEISRLIGRCLRPCVDLSLAREKTIVVDCDVLQADGGTRVACITAASLALELACKRWYEQGILAHNIFRGGIAAVSVGVVAGRPVVDLCYDEDSNADADFNVVMTDQGKLVEIQGTAEKQAVEWDLFDALRSMAQEGIKQIFDHCDRVLAGPQAFHQDTTRILHSSFNQAKRPAAAQSYDPREQQLRDKQEMLSQAKPGLFSIGNRVTKS